jgi:hypothetical protein
LQLQGKGAIFSDHFISVAMARQCDVLVFVTFGGGEKLWTMEKLTSSE